MGQPSFALDSSDHWIPVSLNFNDDDIMEIGSVETQPQRGSQYRWVCMECGAHAGQNNAENPHVVSCSGQLPPMRVRLYRNGMIDHPASIIPSMYVIPSIESEIQ